jgi:hypothetical protein
LGFNRNISKLFFIYLHFFLDIAAINVYTIVKIKIKEMAMRDDNEMSTGKYWQDRAAKMDADLAADIEAAKNPTIDDLLRRLQAMEGANAENGQVFEAEKIEALKNRIAQMEAAREAAFLAEWTIEVTMTRRTAWNGMAIRGDFGTPKKVDWKAYRNAEKMQGWIVDNLKAAIKAHNL